MARTRQQITMAYLNNVKRRRWRLASEHIDIAPNDAAIEDSDHSSTLTKGPSLVYGVRPINFGAYQFANPGWRRRFNTAAPHIVHHIQNLNLQGNSYNGKGAIRVDGAIYQYFTSPQGADTMSIEIDFGTVADREIELLMPYSADIAHLGVTTHGYPISAPATRLTLPRALYLGDSRTQGFAATSVDKHGFELLCQTKGWQHINLGYAGGIVNASWGTTAANLDPDVILITFDKNDQALQTPLATFKSTYETKIANIRAVLPTVNIFVVSSNWINAANDALTLKMADYRLQQSDLVNELTIAGDTNLFYIDGLSLTANDETAVPDGVHLGDAGNAEWATNISPLVSV